MLARMWMPSRLWILSVVIALLALSSLAFAQGGATGGGKFSESDFLTYVDRLGRFAQTEEGRRTFPEIGNYDHQHGDLTFKDLTESVKVKIADERVYYRNEPRDCAGFIEGNQRYFKCDEKRLPLMTLDNQKRYYRMVLHELFVLISLEQSVDSEVLSDYPYSKRIDDHLHLENNEWLPGKSRFESIIRSGVWCVAEYNPLSLVQSNFQESIFLSWNHKGQLVIAKVCQGMNYDEVEVLFRGTAMLPKTDWSLSHKSELIRVGGRDYFPVVKDLNAPQYGSFQLEFLGDPTLTEKTIDMVEGELWNEATARATLHPLRNDLKQARFPMQCQAIESWTESNFAQHSPGLMDWLTISKKDRFKLNRKGDSL